MDPPPYSRRGDYTDAPSVGRYRDDPSIDAVSLSDTDSSGRSSTGSILTTDSENSEHLVQEIFLPIAGPRTNTGRNPSVKEGCRQLYLALRFRIKPYCEYARPYFERAEPYFQQTGSTIWRYRRALLLGFALAFSMGMGILGFFLHYTHVTNQYTPPPLTGPLKFTVPRHRNFKHGSDIVSSRNIFPISFGDVRRYGLEGSHSSLDNTSVDGYQLPSLTIQQNMSASVAKNQYLWQWALIRGVVVVRQLNPVQGIMIQPPAGYIEIETLRNDRATFVEATFNATTQTLRMQLDHVASRRIDAYEASQNTPAIVIRITVWVPPHSALENLSIKTTEFGIVTSSDLDLFVASNGTLATRGDGIYCTRDLSTKKKGDWRKKAEVDKNRYEIPRFTATSLNVSSFGQQIRGSWSMGDRLLLNQGYNSDIDVTIYRSRDYSAYHHRYTSLYCVDDGRCNLPSGCCESIYPSGYHFQAYSPPPKGFFDE